MALHEGGKEVRMNHIDDIETERAPRLGRSAGRLMRDDTHPLRGANLAAALPPTDQEERCLSGSSARRSIEA